MNDLFSGGETERRRVLTVPELNEEIRAALTGAFPAALWVRGEVQRLPVDAARRKHVYFELHGTGRDAAVSIPVALLEWDRRRYGLQRYLDGSDPDFRLADKLEVCLQCVVDFYPPFGKLQLKLVGVDTTFTLGQLEARRRRVMAHLKEHGLLDLNGRLDLPRLPLHVGLVTSAGSAAERDFLVGLRESGYGFRVRRADCRMMGEAMVPQVTGALAGLARAGVDVIVLTRGGGSRADLSWFDHQAVAEAIARCSVPVITAIGHEIDRSIADAVAHHACKTPTAAAQDLAGRLDAAAREVAALATGLHAVATSLLEGRRRALRDAASRLRLAVAARVNAGGLGLVRRRERVLALARLRLERAAERRRRAAGGLAPAARRLCAEASRRCVSAAADLPVAAAARLAAAVQSLEHLGEKAALLDPERLLARGYSLTMGPDGNVLSRAGDARPGDRLTTRLRGGRIESIVDEVDTTGGE
ncbi:exodeoxyribonuclease VII large subunit [bacterium]|nr:exodeoxyribonuclease VII large subunit [bacterium]